MDKKKLTFSFLSILVLALKDLRTCNTLKSFTFLIELKFHLNVEIHLDNNFFQDIPIAVAFKAMGFECEQEFVQMIGSEEEILAAIAPCLEECHRAQVFSQLQVNLLIV